MAGYIIIKSAMDSARRHREEEEAKEKEMIAQGYKRELVQINKSWCYTHTFRNLNKQKSGLMWCIISMFLILMSMNLVLLTNVQWFWTSMPLFVITFFVGIGKYYNKEDVSNDTKEPPVRGDCIYLNTVHDPRYDWQWVKKEVKKNGGQK